MVKPTIYKHNMTSAWCHQ